MFNLDTIPDPQQNQQNSQSDLEKSLTPTEVQNKSNENASLQNAA